MSAALAHDRVARRRPAGRRRRCRCRAAPRCASVRRRRLAGSKAARAWCSTSQSVRPACRRRRSTSIGSNTAARRRRRDRRAANAARRCARLPRRRRASGREMKPATSQDGKTDEIDRRSCAARSPRMRQRTRALQVEEDAAAPACAAAVVRRHDHESRLVRHRLHARSTDLRTASASAFGSGHQALLRRGSRPRRSPSATHTRRRTCRCRGRRRHAAS